jgi:uncharacterized protein YlxW (UPF0749 family)
MPEQPAHEGAPASGRQRLLASLVRPSRRQIVVGILLAALGFAAIVQIRTNEVDDTYAGYREQDLIDVLNGLAGTSQRAQAEISRLEDARDALQSDTSARQAALEQSQTEARNLRILAGLVPVTGPGLRITLKQTGESAIRVDRVVDLVQELRNAGAEAMQVNGQVRVVAQTAFEETSQGLVVGGVQLSPPYVVDVIGASDTLAGALTFPSGPIDQLVDADGQQLTYDELGSLDIESVIDADDPQYARPDLSGS